MNPGVIQRQPYMILDVLVGATKSVPTFSAEVDLAWTELPSSCSGSDCGTALPMKYSQSVFAVLTFPNNMTAKGPITQVHQPGHNINGSGRERVLASHCYDGSRLLTLQYHPEHAALSPEAQLRVANDVLLDSKVRTR